ncbi:MAG: tetratricopeptide repeat protein [Cyanobacteria bacterium P01_D01_bin.71]
MPPTDLDAANQYELRKLVLSIEAQPQQLGLLLAVCDDRNLQARLIDDYEAELTDAGLVTRQVRLSHKRPSLKAALTALVERESALQTGDPAVVTVLNAGELLGVRLTEEKSEQEKFFFSLQWTREALLQFNFPIVLWLPDDVATRLAQRAPDFWSWRSGVFEFTVARPDFLAAAPSDDQQPLMISTADEPTTNDSQIPIADLEQQIAILEANSPESPLLATLYNELGNVYGRTYRYRQALEFFKRALAIAKKNNSLFGQAVSLKNIGDALSDFGRSRQAIDFYKQALILHQRLKDSNSEGDLLTSLGLAHEALGQYQQARDFYQESLRVSKHIGSRKLEAAALSNLANISFWTGKYRNAIDLHQSSLNIERNIGSFLGEATSLGNLGTVYQALEQYEQALEYFEKNLEISQEIGDVRGVARSLINIGNTYVQLNQHHRALAQYQKALEISRQLGERKGEALSLGGLGHVYAGLEQRENAIDCYKQQLVIAQEIGDRRDEAYSLFNQADVLSELSERAEARSHYEAAKAIFSELGLQDLVERCEAAIQKLEE